MKIFITLAILASISVAHADSTDICFVAKDKAIAELGDFPDTICLKQIDSYFPVGSHKGTTSLRGQKYFYEPQLAIRDLAVPGLDKVVVTFGHFESEGMCSQTDARELTIEYRQNILSNDVVDIVTVIGTIIRTHDNCHSAPYFSAEINYVRQ